MASAGKQSSPSVDGSGDGVESFVDEDVGVDEVVAAVVSIAVVDEDEEEASGHCHKEEMEYGNGEAEQGDKTNCQT